MISAQHMGASAGRRNQSLAALERDTALQRVSRTRRWMIAGAAALSAAFAALVSSAAPGQPLRSRGQSASIGTARAAAPVKTSNRMPPLASPGDLGLQGPSSAPQPTPDPSQAAASSQSQAAPAPSQDPAQVAPAPAPTPAPAVSGGS